MFRRWRAADSAARSAADPLPMIRTSVSRTGSFDRVNGTSVRGINASPQRHKGGRKRPFEETLQESPSLCSLCLCGASSLFGGLGGRAVEGAVPVAQDERLDHVVVELRAPLLGHVLHHV